MNLNNFVQKNKDEPLCDLIHCLSCGWRGKVEEGIYVREGDFESGYYDDRDCPKCDGGGEIEYEMSDEQAKKWFDWNSKSGTD